ncbi:unnamed protein product [Musa acuminata subsp. malaccensis]|uniref:(wild Malaysian banana) hypothetical protein n=1 Tax=Musa acuminata subsp. malaccensis TaxID=214687 RepID=A0A804HZ37_MUSAM|nr:unnamed protein product [Musa acuminata subsp. malaccensis]
MDDFPGILVRDFGFRPQGKSAPMAASSGGGSANLGFGSGRSSGANGSSGNSRSGWNSNSAGDPWIGVEVSESRNSPAYDDVFGGPTRPSNASSRGPSASSSPPPAFDSIFDGYDKGAGAEPSSSSSLPVYDKPVFDDYIFSGIPGVKSSSSFNKKKVGVIGRSAEEKDRDLSDFDDLIPGFGGCSPPKKTYVFIFLGDLARFMHAA